MNKKTLVYASLVLVWAVLGCSSKNADRSSASWSALSTNEAEWSLVAEHQTGRQEHDPVTFGELSGLAGDASGRIYALDYKAKTVYVLDESLAPVTELGRTGRGPGEFQVPTSIFVDRDTLFVYDVQQTRLSGFALSQPREETLTVVFPSMNPNGGLPAIPMTAYPAGPGQFYTYYETPSTFSDDHEPYSGIGQVREDGVVQQDEVMAFPKGGTFEMHFEQRRQASSSPFHPRVVATGAAGRLLVGWSDSLAVWSVRPGRPSHLVLHDDLLRRPLREATIDSFTSNVVVPYFGDTWADVTKHTPFPDAWPAFFDLTVAEDGSIWVQVDTADRAGRTGWWVYDATGTRIAAVEVAGQVNLEVVRDSTAYAIRTNRKTEATAAVAYRIRR